MKVNSGLTLVAQPQDFFRELVVEALEKQKVTTQPETEYYLVNLLNQFIATEALYTEDAQGGIKDEPLVLLFKEALEQPKARQGVLFRRLGDVSLYTAGFFQASLSRKLVDVDYYIGMGGSAYQHAAVQTPEESLRPLFSELSAKFASLVDVLAEVSEKTSPRAEKDLLRTYELWIKTRSERAAKALKEAGILPNKNFRGDWQ
jgi:hypothetical protein